MKNFALKASLVASLLTTCVFAESAFIGFEGDYSFKSNLKDKINSVSKSQTGLGIKAGNDFDSFRVYVAYAYDLKAKKETTLKYDDADEAKAKLKWTKHSFLIGGDYTPSISNSFKLLAGAYTGVSKLNLEISDETETEKEKHFGIVVGAKLGGIYDINANNAVEFGYKADYTKYNKKYDTRLKETNHGLFAGYTYKF